MKAAGRTEAVGGILPGPVPVELALLLACSSTDSDQGAGVRGWATQGTGANYGVFGKSESTGGVGVGGASPFVVPAASPVPLSASSGECYKELGGDYFDRRNERHCDQTARRPARIAALQIDPRTTGAGRMTPAAKSVFS